MLPAKGKLTDEQVGQVRGDFDRFIKSIDISLSKAAKQIGYSQSSLSEWTRGEYHGDVDAVTRKVNDWIDREKNRAAGRKSEEYVSTRVAEAMFARVKFAHRLTKMLAIVGPSGCGKSLVLLALREKYNAVYITCTPAHSPRALLRSIATELGNVNSFASKAVLLDQCITTLRETKRMLMIDEAQHLRGDSLSLLRSIYDGASVPVIMAGAIDILDQINDRSDGRGQFTSRCIKYNVMADEVADESGGGGSRGGAARGGMFTVDEVKAFFDKRRIRLDRDSLEMLWALACLPNWGAFRLLEDVARIAIDLFPGKVIDRPAARAMLKLLMPSELGAALSMIERRALSIQPRVHTKAG